MKSLKEKGITLVSLVVTIIILLILAGVALRVTLGDNGLFKMAQKAAESYQISSEREYIEQNILSVQLDKYIGNVSSEKLGETLNVKNLDHSLDWHIIKVKDLSYDIGWNYIEKGTELQNFGKAEYSWLVNYETGEIIQLEEGNYISLKAGDMLAVKDSIIINLDSSIIDSNLKNDKKTLEKQLGEGVTLENFNYNENSGLTNTSFIFDGIDDVILIPYDSSKKIDKGITLEFYGKIRGIGKLDGNLNDGSGNILNGFFELTNKSTKAPALRFGIDINNSKIEQLVWNIGLWHTLSSDFKGNFKDRTEDSWDRFLFSDFNINIEFNSDIYFTVTMDGNNEETNIYINGKQVAHRKI